MSERDFLAPDDRFTFRKNVLEIVSIIPAGRVLSYGDVATLAGSARAARAVGAILKTRGDDVPWQRVINAQMRVSGGGAGGRALIQYEILQGEGLSFDASGRVREPNARWPLDEALEAWEAARGMPAFL